MTNLVNLPRQNSTFLEGDKASREWYNFFRRLTDAISSVESSVEVSGGSTVINNYGNDEPTIIDATTARTLTSSDAYSVIEFTNASAVTVTLNSNASEPIDVDAVIYLTQGNTGQVTVVPGSGVTIEYSDSLKTRTQESTIGLKQYQVDKWELFGDAEPVAPARSALIRSANSVGAPAFVAPTADGQVLKRSSGTLVFGALDVSEVTNAQEAMTSGTAVLVAGTKVVTTAAVTANSRIMLTVQALGTVAVPKAVAATARTAATSFTITSADATDTSTVAWALIEP